MDHDARIAAVQETVRDHDADAFVVTGSPHTFYLSGVYTPTQGVYPVVIVPAEGEAVMLASRLDVDEAVDASALAVTVPDDGILDGIADAVDGEHVIVDGDTSLRMKGMLDDAFRVAVDMDTLGGFREVKDDGEVERIRDAYQVAEQAVDAAIDDVQGGMTELDVAAEIEYMMRRAGSMGVPFPTVVATGDAARTPHHTTDEHELGDGPLLIDCGARIDGYVSDLSRTAYVGDPPRAFRDAYRAVRRAQEESAATLAAGVAAGTVDATARDVLAEAGFPDAFPHATGHGVGITVHEGPKVTRGVDDELEAGNVVTLEPGLYVDGTGIRIEDSYLVTENGAERLTSGSRELQVVER